MSKALIICTLLICNVLFASAVPIPDKHPSNKDKKVSAKVVTELKKSVQFNYGIPLPEKDLDTKVKFEAPKEETTSYFNWIQKKYAEKLDVDPSEVTNDPLYTFINEWYGVRYVYGGTTKRGIDCSSFVQKLMAAAYNVDMVRTAANQHQTSDYINREDLQEGDLVFFKIKVTRISHVGVYLKNGRFVHASSSRGVMISDLNDSYWSRYYAGGGRML